MFLLITLLLAGPGDTPAAKRPADVPVPITAHLSAADLLEGDNRRVRTQHPRLKKMIADGYRRSRTFADLVERIQSTNVIVYIEHSFDLPRDIAGRLLLQTTAGNQRYLRMQINAMLQGDHAIAVMAHELRHALEVADEPSVIDEAGLRSLYQRIGHSSGGNSAFDTDAAREIGRLVANELVG